jgi:protocatechuate 3,4-dioxygenase beta subunit
MDRTHTTCHALFVAFTALALSCAASTEAVAQTPPVQTPTPPQIPKMAGTNIVFGSVVADATGRPVKGAAVTVIVFSTAATFARSVTTDRQGRFIIGGLEAAQVRVSASAPGFLSTSVGKNGPEDTIGTYIPLQDGQPVGPITLRLVKGGVITGAIADGAGEPMGGILVQSFRRSFANSVRQFTASGTGHTDDRGVYRIAGLVPGTYVVGVVPRVVVADSASLERVAGSGSTSTEMMAAMAGVSMGAEENAATAEFVGLTSLVNGGADSTQILSSGSPAPIIGPNGALRGYAPTFFPGTSPSAAQAIRVGSAEEKIADFQLTDVPLGAIAGRIVGPDGTPPPQTALSLVHQGDESVQIGDSLTALAGASGQFSFDDVPVGAYRIEARSRAPTSSIAPGTASGTLWASMPVTLDEKPHPPVVVVLHEGVRVSGAVRFDGAAMPPSGATLTQWSVVLTGADPAPALERLTMGLARAALDDSGHFAFGAALMPGDYQVQVGSPIMPGPWSFASIAAGGAESVDGIVRISGDDIEHATITMTDRQTMVSGTVMDADGKPVTDVTVIALPSNPQLWTPNTRRIVSARPLIDGRYEIKALPPGDYALAVLRTVERGQWFDPEFLTELQAAAERVTIGAGERKTLDLKIR